MGDIFVIFFDDLEIINNAERREIEEILIGW
jgi:hypothetical protein